MELKGIAVSSGFHLLAYPVTAPKAVADPCLLSGIREEGDIMKVMQINTHHSHLPNAECWCDGGHICGCQGGYSGRW